MNLIIFTGHYPYVGEVFLENEIKVAEGFFEQIIIATAEKHLGEISYYVPPNAIIIPYREKMNPIERLIRVFPMFLSRRFWKELFYAKKTTEYSIFTIIKEILIDESEIGYLRRAEKHWFNSNTSGDTVFYSYWLDGAATYLSQYIDKRFVRIARTHGGDCFFDRKYHPYRREQLQELDAVYSISAAGREDLIHHYKTNCAHIDEKVIISRLGVKIVSPKINPWKPREKKRIVTCSNVIPIKRLDLLICALASIQNIKIDWTHFGDGYLMDSIESLAKEKLQGNPAISFSFKGRVNNQEILSFYQNEFVDLFVNCSDNEGIPVSMMEAMLYGIPVIGRNVGGISELVDEQCGKCLSSQADVFELADAIEEMLLMPENTLLEIRNHAAKKIRDYYSAIDNYNTFYEGLKGMLNGTEENR